MQTEAIHKLQVQSLNQMVHSLSEKLSLYHARATAQQDEIMQLRQLTNRFVEVVKRQKQYGRQTTNDSRKSESLELNSIELLRMKEDNQQTRHALEQVRETNVVLSDVFQRCLHFLNQLPLFIPPLTADLPAIDSLLDLWDSFFSAVSRDSMLFAMDTDLVTTMLQPMNQFMRDTVMEDSCQPFWHHAEQAAQQPVPQVDEHTDYTCPSGISDQVSRIDKSIQSAICTIESIRGHSQTRMSLNETSHT
eukprot:GILJ01010002.1.p1 GENE.GILJ01010002.1~~GILJ01010002.1.p1  ORF type:complete len:248 (+),score=50.45 GILJ01010002.1:392-1135(+)